MVELRVHTFVSRTIKKHEKLLCKTCNEIGGGGALARRKNNAPESAPHTYSFGRTDNENNARKIDALPVVNFLAVHYVTTSCVFFLQVGTTPFLAPKASWWQGRERERGRTLRTYVPVSLLVCGSKHNLRL